MRACMYVFRYARTRQQSQLATSALSLSFVTCCARYIVPFDCRRQPPTQLPPNVIPSPPLFPLLLSRYLSRTLTLCEQFITCSFAFVFHCELNCSQFSLVFNKCSNCCIPCKTLHHEFYSLATLTAHFAVAYSF